MRITVTGATGMVGGHVVRAGLAAGHDVIAVRRTTRGPTGPGLATARWVTGRLDDRASLRRAMEGSEAVVHCAAVYAYGPARAAEVDEVNTRGTRSVVEAAAAAGVRRVVVTSSSVTRGSSPGPLSRTESDELGAEPAPAYYLSKVGQERAALQAGHEHGVEVVLALPTVILGGPWRHLAPSNAIVLRYLLDPLRTTYPGGCNVVSAADVATGHLILLEAGDPGGRYLLGGENLTWRQLHTIVAELAGLPGPYAEAPAAVAWLGSAVVEGWARVTGETPLVTRDESRSVGRYYWYSSDRAASLGYAPGGARAAVAESLAWLVASPEVPRWVRERLRLADQVRMARPLVPRELP